MHTTHAWAAIALCRAWHRTSECKNSGVFAESLTMNLSSSREKSFLRGAFWDSRGPPWDSRGPGIHAVPPLINYFRDHYCPAQGRFF